MVSKNQSKKSGQKELEKLLEENPERVAQHKVGNLLDRQQIREEYPELHSDLIEWYESLKSGVGQENFKDDRDIPDVDSFQDEVNHIANSFDSVQELYKVASTDSYDPEPAQAFDNLMQRFIENELNEDYEVLSPVRLAVCEILENSRKQGNNVYINEDHDLPDFVEVDSNSFLLYDDGEGIDNSELTEKMVYDPSSDRGLGLPMINYIDQNTEAYIGHISDPSVLDLEEVEKGEVGCAWYVESSGR